MTKPAYDWTPGAKKLLVELWNHRTDDMPTYTASQIGRALGCTVNQVVGKVRRMCLPPRPSPIVRGVPRPVETPRLPRTLKDQAYSSLAIYLPPPPVRQISDKPIGRSLKCDFVLNDDKPWQKCGKPSVGTCSYCGQHAQICFVDRNQKYADQTRRF
jgi:hypothetical protein